MSERCNACGRLLPKLRNPPEMIELSGRALKAMRRSLLWSQQRLAEELGVTRLTVMLWERGRQKPHRSNLDRIHELAKAHNRGFHE